VWHGSDSGLPTGLGAPTVRLLAASFVVFDLLLCSAAGVTADALVGRRVGES
jgi:hypothetical protein